MTNSDRIAELESAIWDLLRSSRTLKNAKQGWRINSRWYSISCAADVLERLQALVGDETPLDKNPNPRAPAAKEPRRPRRRPREIRWPD